MTNTISDLITRPWATYVFFAAVRLEVFTILGDRKMTAEEIAGECGAVPRLLKALLNACAGMELIGLEGDRFANSQFSRRYLVEGQPQYMGDFFNILSGEATAWLKLANIIREKGQSGETPVAEELDARTFTRGMNNLGMLGEAEALKNAVDLSGCREMVDAGGGSGLYSAVFCREYPDLRSTILDRKEALAAAKELTESYPERERLLFRGADITRDSFGENVDAVLLSDVIYGTTEAEAILKNARDCLRPGGLLVVRGYYADPQGANPLFGSLFVLNMLIFDPSREILTVDSLPRCVEDAGFTDVEIWALTELSTCLTARKR